VIAHPDIAEEVRALLRARAPLGVLSDDVYLGSEGLGLDSIAIAEVLLDCEERWGVDAEELLGERITVGALIGHVLQAAA
jgi:acyl carrier protein